MTKTYAIACLLLILLANNAVQGQNENVPGSSTPVKKLKVPVQASKVGFKKLTFNDDFDSINSIDTSGSRQPGFNWYIDDGVWSNNNAKRTAYQVDHSVLTVTNSGRYTGNWTLASFSSHGKTGHSFKYGYFEARFRFDPTLGKDMEGWPSFWSLSAYHSMVNNMDHWAELDFLEAYTGGFHHFDGAFVGTVHDWADSSKKHFQNSNNWQPLPKGTDFNQWHTYGCLWLPGKITWYFDDRPLMTLNYSPTAPPDPAGKSPAPAGTFSILDSDPKGMLLILGSDTKWPMYVDWVRVWQAK